HWVRRHTGRGSPQWCRRTAVATGRKRWGHRARRMLWQGRRVSWGYLSALLVQVEEHDARRVADGGVLAGEGEAAGLAVHPEGGDVVRPLVAAVEEPAGRVEGEAPRVTPPRPLLPGVGQGAARPDGEDGDAVVQPVPGVHEPAVGRDQDLGAEVAAGEPRRQGGDRLPGGQPAGRGVVIEPDDGRAFLLDGVQPPAVRVE